MTNPIDTIMFFAEDASILDEMDNAKRPRLVFYRGTRKTVYCNPSPKSLKRLCKLLNRRVSYSYEPQGSLYVYEDGWNWESASLV